MDSNDPGVAPVPSIEDPQKRNVECRGFEDDRPVAPDQFDPVFETSRKEIWAYYAYYVGDNGLTLFNFAPTAFQNLLSQAAGDRDVLNFAGRERTINSIVLLASGISFAIQGVIFLVIGSYADFGHWRPNILIVLSVVAFGIGFGWLGVHTADQWQAAAGMYIIVGLIAYQTTLTFWTAAFPGLARNTPQLRSKAEEYNNGAISREDLDFVSMMQRRYFTLGDSLNTTVTVIATLQNKIVAYDTLQLTYLLLVGIAAQAVGIYGFWWIQQRYCYSTKTMFTAVMIAIILLLVSLERIGITTLTVISRDGWGMVGIWTQKFGFHHVWQVWVYQTFYGLFVCPWYSYSQIMISEVTPRGKEFLFFSLFSIVGKTSSFIGPIVSSAIVDASPNSNSSTPFYFPFGLSSASAVLLVVGVDLKESRWEQEAFLEDEKIQREKLAERSKSF
ncbi:MAG: hypothetical protein Q9183_001559 [Haloplaca sp. 2 TL-2023]